MPKSQYFTWISSVSTNPIYPSEIDASTLIDMDNPYVFFCPLRILLIFPSQHLASVVNGHLNMHFTA